MIVFNNQNYNKLFYVGLFIKIGLGLFLASPLLTDLFIPFIDYFVRNNLFANPYQNFLNDNAVATFPYPALMLYILSVPKLVLGWIAPNNVFFNLLLIRLPLLIADIAVFLVILSWLQSKYHKKLILFYWFSPVLIYISYIHGQLDVIPIALLLISMFFLFKEKHLWSALFLGLALSTKLNIALVYPFYLLYLLSKSLKLAELLTFFAIAFVTFLTINAPFLFDYSFYEMVFNNQENVKVFNSFMTLNEMILYLIPAAYIVLFVQGVLLKTYNRDIFIMFLGFTFSIILLFIPPQQGWYFWLLPFLCYFYIKEDGRSSLLFISLQILYILYFMVIESSDYFIVWRNVFESFATVQNIYHLLVYTNLDADKIANIIFTALQTALLVNCFWIYKKGLESYSQHKLIASPFLIGIGGNSGTGKTTLSKIIAQLFAPANTSILCGDDMHKWQRGHEKWDELTHLDPKANHLHQEIHYLRKLSRGYPILRRHYDHDTGQFTSKEKLIPKNIIVFEGLHPFYLPSQRLLYDLKIFLNPSIELMYHWKIIRDQKKRGYSKQKVIDSIQKRKKDAKSFIEVQKKYADIIIETLPLHTIKDVGNTDEIVEYYYHLVLSNDTYLEPLLVVLEDISTLEITHKYTANDHQEIILKGSISEVELNVIAEEYLNRLRDLGLNQYNLPQGLDGVLTVIIAYYIFEKIEYDRK